MVCCHCLEGEGTCRLPLHHALSWQRHLHRCKMDFAAKFRPSRLVHVVKPAIIASPLSHANSHSLPTVFHGFCTTISLDSYLSLSAPTEPTSTRPLPLPASFARGQTKHGQCKKHQNSPADQIDACKSAAKENIPFQSAAFPKMAAKQKSNGLINAARTGVPRALGA